MKIHGQRFRALPGAFAVCRLTPESAVPGWAHGPFVNITFTDDELAIICPADRVPADIRAERDWRVLKLVGPFPFTATGVLASLATPLARAGRSNAFSAGLAAFRALAPSVMSPARWWWQLLRLPLVLFGGGYGVLICVAPAIATGMLYYPRIASHTAPAGSKVIPGSNGAQLAVLYLPNPSARYTLWYFPGNAEALGDIAPYLQRLHDAGFAVFAFDYPGYGASTGAPSEKTIYAAARMAREYLRRDLGVTAAQTLLYGRSLGGGPATQLATEESVGGLILQSAFTSAYRVMTRWPLVPFDQYRNLAKLRRVHVPVLVMHGESDEVIPWHHGQSLFAVASEPKRSLWIPGAHHNDFVSVAGKRLFTALQAFAGECARRDTAPTGNVPK